MNLASACVLLITPVHFCLLFSHCSLEDRSGEGLKWAGLQAHRPSSACFPACGEKTLPLFFLFLPKSKLPPFFKPRRDAAASSTVVPANNRTPNVATPPSAPPRYAAVTNPICLVYLQHLVTLALTQHICFSHALLHPIQQAKNKSASMHIHLINH